MLLKMETAWSHRVCRLAWACLVMLALIAARAPTGFAREASDITCIVAINGPNIRSDIVGPDAAWSEIKMHDLPGLGVLIGAERERALFLARTAEGKVTIVPASDADTGGVWSMRDFPGGGVLIQGAEGWFLAREVDSKVTVLPLRDVGIIDVIDTQALPGGGVLILD